MSNNKAKYISLKEAATLSGYAPDYIGQLIRDGKIIGKQVYSNPAWVTTEEAIKNYLQKRREPKDTAWVKGAGSAIIGKIHNGTFPEYKVMRIFSTGLWFIIFWSVIFFFVLFYIFSVNFEKSVNQKIIEKSNLNYELLK